MYLKTLYDDVTIEKDMFQKEQIKKNKQEREQELWNVQKQSR